MTETETNGNGHKNGEKFYKVSHTTLLGVVALAAGGSSARLWELPGRVETVAEDVKDLSADVRDLRTSVNTGNAEVIGLLSKVEWLQSRVDTLERRLQGSEPK